MQKVKIKICNKEIQIIWFIVVIFVCICLYISSTFSLHGKDDISVFYQRDEEIEKMENENLYLHDTIDSILPEKQKDLYIEPYRFLTSANPIFPIVSLENIVKKGTDIPFKTVYYDVKYQRPVYDSQWRDFYFRMWLYLPYKISEASHQLYIFPMGASNTFDLLGSLGFTTELSYDTHKDINCLIYNFHVQHIKQYKNQIALIGKPASTGVQIVAVTQDLLLPSKVNQDQFLFQLSTPGGYELDYIYSTAIRNEYLRKMIEKHSIKSVFKNAVRDSDGKVLEEEKKKLLMLLGKYIPLERPLTITEKDYKKEPKAAFTKLNYEVKTILDKGKEIPFIIKYENDQYQRPLYDPEWGTHTEKGWAYLPQKMYEAMHRLYVISDKTEERSSLFGSLGFHGVESFTQNGISNLLIYGFKPEKIMKYNSQVIITGVPMRSGVHVVGISDADLGRYRLCKLQLVTPDNYEIDKEYMKRRNNTP